MSRLSRLAAAPLAAASLAAAGLIAAPLLPAAAAPLAAPVAAPAAASHAVALAGSAKATPRMLLTSTQVAAASKAYVKAGSLAKVGSPASTGVGWYQGYKAKTRAGVPMSIVVEVDAMPSGTTFTALMKRWAKANKASVIKATDNAWFGYVLDSAKNRALYVTFAHKGNRAWIGEAFVGVPLTANKTAFEAAAKASLGLAAAQQTKNSTPQG